MTKKIIKTKFGTVITKLNSKQNKLINELAFTTTDPTLEVNAPSFVYDGSIKTRHVPEYEIKQDHLLISGIELVKNLKTGNWEIAKINTNQGIFAAGSSQNEKLDQQSIRKLALQLKEILQLDIEFFLKEEVK